MDEASLSRLTRGASRAARQDVVLAVGLLVALALSTPLFAALEPGPPVPLGLLVLWALALTLPLAVRRRWPAAVAAVVAGAYVLGQVAGLPEELMSQAAVMVALYSAGAHDPDRRRAALVRGGVALLFLTWLVVALVQQRDQGAGEDYAVLVVITVLSNVLALSAATALGELAWLAQQRQRALEARGTELRAERDRVAAQAVVLERMAIARELHDVVAHHVSVMGVQAAVARRLLHRAPEQAETALGEVEEAARGAVAELGGLVLALRTVSAGGPGDEASDPAPASTLGLDQVPALVESARQAGTEVELQCRGDLRAPTPVVGYAVYRLVQESLTNVRKHAGVGARARVAILVDDGAVEVRVVDDGARRGAAPAGAGVDGAGGSGGLGLLGMRERLAAVGGRVDVTRTSHGFAVSAVLPAPGGGR